MKQTIISNLYTRFGAYEDLVAQIDDDALQTKLDIEKHKSIAEHLWCLIGSRESHAKALLAGQWLGFSCSMSSFTRSDFQQKLTQSAQAVTAAINSVDEWTDHHDSLLANLAEHEVMHEGQIIRHVLGTGGTLPSSWKWA